MLKNKRIIGVSKDSSGLIIDKKVMEAFGYHKGDIIDVYIKRIIKK